MSASNLHLLRPIIADSHSLLVSWPARIGVATALIYGIRHLVSRNVVVSVVPPVMTEEETQAVMIYIRLSSDGLGTPGEVQRMHNLQDKLEAAVLKASVGELDGDEFGGGYCTIYLYGPDAKALFETIEPLLKQFDAPPDSYIVQQFGRAGSEELRISFPRNAKGAGE